MKNIKQIIDKIEKDNQGRHIVNMFDNTFLADSFLEASLRCGNREMKTGESPRKPELVKYVMQQNPWSGITYFTDKTFHLAPGVESDIKIAWIIEPRALLPHIYDAIVKLENHFDLIFTYDEKLLTRNPSKYKFHFADTVNVDQQSIKIHEKTKLVSMAVSEKTWLFGHRLRHIIMKTLIPNIKYDKVDFYGAAANNFVQMKSDTLNDYMFQITIENAKSRHYFADKIYDCLATGVVPIYWGAPNIGDYFDTKGIITFDTPDDLTKILNNITPEKYYSMSDAIKTNFDIVTNRYMDPDDLVFTNTIKYLDEINKFGAENV